MPSLVSPLKHNKTLYSSANVSLNSKYTNTAIDYTLLSPSRMEELGFRYIENLSTFGDPVYYYCKRLDLSDFIEKKQHNNTPSQTDPYYITFNITLPIPYNQDKLEIAIIDEEFCQHYDFQSYLQGDPNFEFAKCVAEQVEKEMSRFSEEGIISGHKYGEYI